MIHLRYDYTDKILTKIPALRVAATPRLDKCLPMILHPIPAQLHTPNPFAIRRPSVEVQTVRTYHLVPGFCSCRPCSPRCASRSLQSYNIGRIFRNEVSVRHTLHATGRLKSAQSALSRLSQSCSRGLSVSRLWLLAK